MRIKTIIVAAVAVGLFGVSACSPKDDPPGASSTPSASSGAGVGAGANGRDGCLIGTWKVDVNDMAVQAAAKMTQPGATGAGTGSITLVFGDSMTITYDNVMTITVPMSTGLTMKMAATFTGAATSSDWQAKDGKLAGTMPTNTVTEKLAATIDGQTVPLPNIPFQGALNMNEGNLGYTCSGSAATFTSPHVEWKLTKA